MRTIAHLSDLHFGRVDEATLAPLRELIIGLKPNLVAISGDLTQRARHREFAWARKFLDTLPLPQLVVPGNHDIPLHNPLSRFIQPLKRFHRYIAATADPFFQEPGLAVLGLNSARSLTTKHGRLNSRQIARIREHFCAVPAGAIKILVSHHPFHRPPGHEHERLVGGAAEALRDLGACQADLILSGHLHISHTHSSVELFEAGGHSVLLVQAGTATSVRTRGEANSFNVLRIARPHLEIVHYRWHAAHGQFEPAHVAHYRHSTRGWRPDEVQAPASEANAAKR